MQMYIESIWINMTWLKDCSISFFRFPCLASFVTLHGISICFHNNVATPHLITKHKHFSHHLISRVNILFKNWNIIASISSRAVNDKPNSFHRDKQARIMFFDNVRRILTGNMRNSDNENVLLLRLELSMSIEGWRWFLDGWVKCVLNFA